MNLEANKAVVLNYIDELNRRNLNIIRDLVAADFQDTVLQGYERNTTAFPDYFVQVEEILADGDKVVILWIRTGTHLGEYEGIPPTGKKIHAQAVTIYKISDGKIAGADGAWDQAELWQQLGVLPDTSTLIEQYRIANEAKGRSK